MTPQHAPRGRDGPGRATPPGSPATTPSRPVLAIIAAVAANSVIGAGNRLPWRLAPDLERFRALTTGHTVVMGRRTWESIARPLPGRQNVVVTTRHGFAASGAEIAPSLQAALALARMPEPVFCIGGGELYASALPRAAALYLTEIARPFDGDARFPELDRRAWREIARESHEDPQSGLTYAFVTYERAR